MAASQEGDFNDEGSSAFDSSHALPVSPVLIDEPTCSRQFRHQVAASQLDRIGLDRTIEYLTKSRSRRVKTHQKTARERDERGRTAESATDFGPAPTAVSPVLIDEPTCSRQFRHQVAASQLDRIGLDRLASSL
jgi:hypothetical protein